MNDYQKIIENADLTSYSTMRVSATAAYLTYLEKEEQIKSAIDFAKEKQIGVLVIGEGSNILFKNRYSGLIIVNSIKGIQCNFENDDFVKLIIGSGENWHQFVKYTVEHCWAGIENLALIPGTIGAAPVQNIGAYGVELESVFDSCRVYDMQNHKIKTFNHTDCEFGYRDSHFKQHKNRYIITSVTLKLSKHFMPKIVYKALQDNLAEKNISEPNQSDIYQTVIELRKSKLPDPKSIGNNGSFFKNPVILRSQFNKLRTRYPHLKGYDIDENKVKVAAAWLIDNAGWKGYKDGDVGVYDKQALVLVNYGKASGEDIWNLAKKIILSVKGKYDIELEPEVNII